MLIYANLHDDVMVDANFLPPSEPQPKVRQSYGRAVENERTKTDFRVPMYPP